MNRQIVITGASSEIGLAICQKMHNPDDKFIFQYHSHPEELTLLKIRLGSNCTLLKADFRKSEEIEKFIDQIKNTDVLISGAALTITELLINLRDDEVLDMFYVNNLALVKITRGVIPDMLLKRNGIIINISSLTANRGNRGQSAYAGTKGFIQSFSRALAAEYGAKGIRVNCVAPGPIDAGSLKSILPYAKDEIINSISLKRLGKAKDVAACVKFLSSSDAEFINGKVIEIDGGFMHGV